MTHLDIDVTCDAYDPDVTHLDIDVTCVADSWTMHMILM